MGILKISDTANSIEQTEDVLRIQTRCKHSRISLINRYIAGVTTH